jgi:hypothetical protein
MSTPTLIRSSGLCLMLGGIGLAAELFLHPPGETARYVLEPIWGLAHWLGAIAWLLILFGLIGFYARQTQRIGRLGLVGFVLAVTGAALTAGTLMMGGAVLQPVMAEGAPELLDLDGPLFAAAGFKVGAGLILVGFIGLLLLAIATLRVGILPSIGSWILIGLVPVAVVSVPLVLFLAPSLQKIGQPALGMVTGAALLAWGYGLWRDPGYTSTTDSAQ